MISALVRTGVLRLLPPAARPHPVNATPPRPRNADDQSATAPDRRDPPAPRRPLGSGTSSRPQHQCDPSPQERDPLDCRTPRGLKDAQGEGPNELRSLRASMARTIRSATLAVVVPLCTDCCVRCVPGVGRWDGGDCGDGRERIDAADAPAGPGGRRPNPVSPMRREPRPSGALVIWRQARSLPTTSGHRPRHCGAPVGVSLGMPDRLRFRAPPPCSRSSSPLLPHARLARD